MFRTQFFLQRPARWQSAAYSPFALKTRCAFATSLRCSSQSGLKYYCFFFGAWTMRPLCVTGTNLNENNEFRLCVLLVSNVTLAVF